VLFSIFRRCLSSDVSMDVSVHDVDDDGALKELHRASGGPWGVASVSSSFIAWLTQIAGNEVMKKLDEEILVYEDFRTEIQLKLRQSFSENKKVVKLQISCSQAFSEGGFLINIEKMNLKEDVKLHHGYLIISAHIFLSWVQEPISNGIRHISGILSQPAMNDVDTILLVGEFAKCPLVQEKVNEAFKNKTIVIPAYPAEAVVSGAVVCGHQGSFS